MLHPDLREGIAIKFLYPEHNYSHARKRLKPRRAYIRQIVDIDADPRPDIVAADPDLRRSRYLIVVDDLDLGERRKFYEASMEQIEVVRPETQVHFLGEADGGRYGNHYHVAWIRTDDAWHPSEPELPEEFTIDGHLIRNVSTFFAETIASRANVECDILHRRGRWAIVVPAGLLD